MIIVLNAHLLNIVLPRLSYQTTIMKHQAAETQKRTLVKTISWRVVATLTTALLVFAFTGNFTIALEVGAFEVVAKLLLYYLHERGWSHIPWGRNVSPEN